MKFDDFDKKMRAFETAADLCVLPEMFMVTGVVCESKKRTAVPAWNQIQRSSPVAEAGSRSVLGGIREAVGRSGPGTDGPCTASSHPHRFPPADECQLAPKRYH